MLRLVVGLGNPGPDYRATRHNIGFEVVDDLARSHGFRLRPQTTDMHWGGGRIEDQPIWLAKPMGYMNRSGEPTRRLADRLCITVREMLVIHDDIDLKFGRIKIKEKGGSGGHNGLNSLIGAFDGGDFTRLRIGIGRPQPGVTVVDHVLERFVADETAQLPELIARAGRAVRTMLAEGTPRAMESFNRKPE